MLFFNIVHAQQFTLKGKITDTRMQPIAFATVQVKDSRMAEFSKEDGGFEFNLIKGAYTLIVTMTGYKTQLVEVLASDNIQPYVIILEEDPKALEEVVVKAKIKDRAEEIIRNVISRKEAIAGKAGAYSAQVYIKASQEPDSAAAAKAKNKNENFISGNIASRAMAEIVINLDYESKRKIKEVRTGVEQWGNTKNLFYLTTTDGNFDLYNNMLDVPKLSQSPLVSPISYSGLVAYKFKTIATNRKVKPRVYTISFKPTLMSNLTLEGIVEIEDSTFKILSAKYSFPKYHLQAYDYFEVEQQYTNVNDTAWMITRQLFNYITKAGKNKLYGTTEVSYKQFDLNKNFSKNHFGVELGSTAASAYNRDSSFWNTARDKPLTTQELGFIRYQDSLFAVRNTSSYLDSLDKETNRITWQKILLFGQPRYNRGKQQTILFPPLVEFIQPLGFGGPRISPGIYYSRVFENRKRLSVDGEVSYGFNNRDVNGSIWVEHLYNPFIRGHYWAEAGRDFQFIFNGDAWINMLKRSNRYLNNSIKLGHGIELFNGFNLYTDVEVALRRDLSNYKVNNKIDSIVGGEFLSNNQVVKFDPYNATYGKVRITYTPRQKYLREPLEKIILGSSYPTFFAIWRKGMPGIFKSEVDFDYLELGMEQTIKMGILGISRYNLRSGSFLNQKELQLVDYKFQRRGDPWLFMNPDHAFQSLDSTFPIFKWYYQGHYVHEFNGFLFNRIPIFKKLQLREILGGGVLVAPEKNLRYFEMFTGIERVLQWDAIPQTKFKLGIYVTGSVANKINGPVQFKVGLTTWNRRYNKWN